jgi:hypothetical protein
MMVNAAIMMTVVATMQISTIDIIIVISGYLFIYLCRYNLLAPA